MRWEDETYVRVYTRDTAEWVALGWEGQCLLMQLMRKCDRVGILELGKAGVRGLAALLRMPSDIVERALSVLVDDGCVTMCDTTLVVRNFLEAQNAVQSNKLRKERYNDRQRDKLRAMNVNDGSHFGTRENAEERDGTKRNAVARDGTLRYATLHNADHIFVPTRSAGSEPSAGAASPGEDSRSGSQEPPGEVFEPPNDPAPVKRSKTPGRGRYVPAIDISPEELSPAELRGHNAITGDPTLAPICKNSARLARDLMRSGPGVDVQREICRAGSWLRAHPERMKKNGNAFLLNWINRAQEECWKQQRAGPSQAAPQQQSKTMGLCEVTEIMANHRNIKAGERVV